MLCNSRTENSAHCTMPPHKVPRWPAATKTYRCAGVLQYELKEGFRYRRETPEDLRSQYQLPQHLCSHPSQVARLAPRRPSTPSAMSTGWNISICKAHSVKEQVFPHSRFQVESSDRLKQSLAEVFHGGAHSLKVLLLIWSKQSPSTEPVSQHPYCLSPLYWTRYGAHSSSEEDEKGSGGSQDKYCAHGEIGSLQHDRARAPRRHTRCFRETHIPRSKNGRLTLALHSKSERQPLLLSFSGERNRGLHTGRPQ